MNCLEQVIGDDVFYSIEVGFCLGDFEYPEAGENYPLLFMRICPGDFSAYEIKPAEQINSADRVRPWN